MFAKNVGGIDRILRIVLGVVLILGFFVIGGDSGWKYLFWLGLIPLLTGIFRTCGLYSVLGITTRKTG